MKKRNIAFMGIFLALALVLGYVETFIPLPQGIPGMKLGLTNLIIVIILYCEGTKEAYIISATRVILSGFLFGNVQIIIFSLGGAMLSLTAMALLKRTNNLNVITISAVGGVMHNIGQIVVAMITVQTFSIKYYIPVLVVVGLITGLIIGAVANELIKRLHRFF